MSDYEQRQQRRKERYKELSEKASVESDQRYERGKEILDPIPFGQPILVGHHSEKRHRSALAKAESNFRKSVELHDKSKHYEQKAASVGKAGISADDPQAVEKLKRRLAAMEQAHTLMLDVNKAIRKGVVENPFRERGITDERWQKLRAPNYMNRVVGFESWQLSNNNANMKRIAKRIATLERATTPRPDSEGDGYTLREEQDLNRIQFLFDTKPDEATRDLLKRNGFRWSPTNVAWQRQLNEAGRSAAARVITQLKGV